MIDLELIKNNFSKHASCYDRYASIQKQCAGKLLKELRSSNYKNILDIGCGTGIYTKLLRDKFPRAKIEALDCSSRMIKIAKQKFKGDKINFIMADAQEIPRNQKFDLITSNAAFQWFSNLGETLLDYKKILEEKGCILFSIFGPKTFCELKKSLDQMNFGSNFITSSIFCEKAEITYFLKNNFIKSYVKEEILKEESDNLGDFLKKIKYTGTRGFGLNQKKIWTKEKIKKLEEIYQESFGKIVASYQVFFVKAYI